jgi:hypothetical protein
MASAEGSKTETKNDEAGLNLIILFDQIKLSCRKLIFQ